MIMMVTKGSRCLKMLPRGILRSYVLPARGLVVEETCGILTLLLEEVLFFPEMLAFTKVSDDYLYGSIAFESATKVFGTSAPSVRCLRYHALPDSVEDEIRLVKDSLLDFVLMEM